MAGDADVEQQKKQWRVNRKNENASAQARTIQPGDSGIWATCTKGKEGKCIGELRDLFAEYAEQLYGDTDAAQPMEEVSKAASSIENDIDAELAELSKPTKIQLFKPVRLEVQCGTYRWPADSASVHLTDLPTVVFFKTVAPVDPVAVVKQICQDAMNEPLRKRTRFVKRLSPMTLMGRASEEGLEKVATEVLAPHFHQQPFQPRQVSDPVIRFRRQHPAELRAYRRCNDCFGLAAWIRD